MNSKLKKKKNWAKCSLWAIKPRENEIVVWDELGQFWIVKCWGIVFLESVLKFFNFFFTMFKWHPNGRITYKIQRQYEASSKTVNTPLTLLFQPQCVDVCQECISMSLRASQTIWYRQTERMDWWSRRGSDGGEKDWMLILQRKMRPFLLVMCLI